VLALHPAGRAVGATSHAADRGRRGVTRTQKLVVRNNQLHKIENLDALTSLRELDLYDNQITALENLSLPSLTYSTCFSRPRAALSSCFSHTERGGGGWSVYVLRYLDVSFNVFRRIENLTHEGLPHLTELYLIAAKISKIEGEPLFFSVCVLQHLSALPPE
jgi:Leucine-rich repeat (LRR) protein